MKALSCLLVGCCILAICSHTDAQISNLVVNGSSTNFTMTSGDSIRWEYNIPIGATASGELWYDVNQNGIIDPGIDKARFLFMQTDGDTTENGGPPDLDGAVDGHVIFYQRVGIAPGKYVFRLTHNSVSQQVTGTATALSSPAHTISGTVTPPAGKSPQYIFVQAKRNENGGLDFWDAVTDVSGNFAIKMDADTVGNPWRIRLSDNYNPFPPTVVSPEEISLTITGDHSGNNFVFLQAAAQAAGYLKDESGTPLGDRGVFINRNDGGVNRSVRTDASGFYQIGLLSGELTNQTWHLQSESNGNVSSGQLQAEASLPIINPGDSLFRTLTIYTANATIQGLVRVNGSPPGFPVKIVASNSDSASTETWADSSTGVFILSVTNKIYNYMVFPNYLPPEYQYSSVTAHPGDTGVIIDITLTEVKERAPGIPSEFALHQNYPNPFNPTTRIDYDIPSNAHVRLSVFNLLGQEIVRLVDRDQHPGEYTVTLDGSKLPSGAYFYEFKTGTYSSVKKMILMK